MMNGENANIIIPTLSTLAAKGANQGKFALPVTAALLQFIAVFVPIILLAFGTTELCISGLAAIRASSSIAPSVSMITCHATKLGCISTIGRYLKGLTALFAGLGDLCVLSHGVIIQRLWAIVKSTYFDIAVKRIEQAMMQPRLEGL